MTTNHIQEYIWKHGYLLLTYCEDVDFAEALVDH